LVTAAGWRHDASSRASAAAEASDGSLGPSCSERMPR
jgi:hypothetical protein